MIALYLQLNIFVAIAWLLFQILPKKRLSYRATKVVAQTLLLTSLVAVPFLVSLPDFSFPHFSKPVELIGGQDIDGLVGAAAALPQKLQQASTLTGFQRRDFSQPTSLWPALVLAGFAFMLLRLLRTWLRLHKLLRATYTLHSLGRTRVVLAENIAVPFSVLHLGRAYVVLPSALIPHRRDFAIALKHEIEHHRRRDTLWAIALEWLICAFYLNPAIYLWRKTILKLQELACDEALISRMRISAHAYGSCLLRVAEMALGSRFKCAGTTCMIPTSEPNGHSFLRRRIKMFGQHESATAKKTVAIISGTLASLAIFAGAYVAQAAVRSGTMPNPGKAVFDSKIQALAEEALKKGIAKHDANAGFAIVADPNTGKVLAAVSINKDFDESLKGDWALAYPLEPGSALKPLVAATALQSKATRIDEMHDCENGSLEIGKRIYHDVERYAKLSTMDAVVHSSNICTIKIARKVGAQGLEHGLREFGLGSGGSAEEFPGARPGNVPVAGVIPDINYVILVSHGISNRTGFHITPLELVQAYGAMANGGHLIRAGGGPIRDVLSPEVAGQMRDVLRQVVERGTGQRIKGSTIPLAGKTATVITAQNRRITGFIGFAPVDKPKLVVYVALFEPKGDARVGSTTAAPVFREIIEKTVPAYNP